MLKTTTDFETNINFLVQGINEEMNKGILYQTTSINSEDFNSTLETIENRLNQLYEKTRIVEDVIIYAKEYLKSNIYETVDECRSILKSIEEDRDSLKDSSYIAYDVPFNSSSGSYVDRDGMALPESSVKNGLITLSGNIKTNSNIKSIKKNKGIIPYRNNINELQNNEPYRSFYILDGPIIGGLKEEITIELQSPTEINYLDTTPSNCVIDYVEYINENDTVDQDDKPIGTIIKDRKIKAIKLMITSQVYKKSTYEIDANRMASTFWDKVQEKEYNDVIGVETVYDFDELSGLKSYLNSYNDYVIAYNVWVDENNRIAEQNKALIAEYDKAYNQYLNNLNNWSNETGQRATPITKHSFVSQSVSASYLDPLYYESIYKKNQVYTLMNPNVLSESQINSDIYISPLFTRDESIMTKINAFDSLDPSKNLNYYNQLNKSNSYSTSNSENNIEIFYSNEPLSKLIPVINHDGEIRLTSGTIVKY